MITYTYLGGPADGKTCRAASAPYLLYVHHGPAPTGKSFHIRESTLHKYRTRRLQCLKRGHRLAVYVGPEKP